MSCPAIAESQQDLITKRLEYFSKSFIDRPYLASPLGEGRGIDTDPLLRYDAFDCTTYVETVIASALAETDADIVNLLNRIRYTNGRIDFASRRHLPEFQWLAELEQQQVLTDITQKIAGSQTRFLRASISPDIWKQRRWRIVHQLEPAALPHRSISLPYIPLDFVETAFSNITQISLISIVRQPRDDAPLLVTHHAFVLPIKGYLYVRHASPDKQAVIDELLPDFLRRLRKQRHWPVAGLNVVTITGTLPQ